MDLTTQRLARYAHAFDLATIDARSLHECRLRLLDAAACAIAAYREPFCEHNRSFASRFAGPQNARLWGSGQRASLEMTAFANGTTLRYLDFSDTYMSRNAGHPSDMIGALVATAEAMDRDGSALTAALVVAYELYGGLCDAVALRDHGVDQATCAAVGTAAGVGRLLGLNEAHLGRSYLAGARAEHAPVQRAQGHLSGKAARARTTRATECSLRCWLPKAWPVPQP